MGGVGAYENVGAARRPFTDLGRWMLLRQLSRKPLSVVGLAIVGLLLVVVVAGPWVAPQLPDAIDVEARLSAPSPRHPMGTDDLGRDILSRVIYGTRTSASVAVLAVGLALPVGTMLGLVSGYFGGRLDQVIMRGMDLLFAFPPLLLALFVTAMLGPSLRNAMIAIGVVFTPSFARVARGAVLSLKGVPFVEAARAIGAGDLYLIRRHLLPNAAPSLIVQTTLSLAWAILTEASLSFIGLGVQPPAPSWGGMLNEARRFLQTAPWMAVSSGMPIALAIFGFSLLGDALRDILDPKLRD